MIQLLHTLPVKARSCRLHVVYEVLYGDGGVVIAASSAKTVNKAEIDSKKTSKKLYFSKKRTCASKNVLV